MLVLSHYVRPALLPVKVASGHWPLECGKWVVIVKIMWWTGDNGDFGSCVPLELPRGYGRHRPNYLSGRNWIGSVLRGWVSVTSLVVLSRLDHLSPNVCLLLIFISTLTVFLINFFNKMNDQSWYKIKSDKHLEMEAVYLTCLYFLFF
jgi:hypothetical protein